MISLPDMSKRNRDILKYSSFIFLMFTFLLPGLSQSARKGISQDDFFFDRTLRKGKLKNGLSYFIQNAGKSSGVANISFIVKTGYYYEEEGESDFAHLLEHLGGRGTKLYPSGYINFIEQNGMVRGTNVNASVSGEFTRYYVNDIPASGGNLIKEVLMRFSDISSNIILDSISLHTEAGAVVSEGIGVSDEEGDFWRAMNFHLLNDTRWGNSISKPLKREIKHFNLDRVSDFYQKWYRPDREAVVIVGDIDVDYVEKLIKKIFSNIEKPRVRDGSLEKPSERAVFDGKKDLIVIPKDEQKDIAVWIVFKNEKYSDAKNESDFVSDIIHQAFYQITMNRINKVIKEDGSEFINRASIVYNDFQKGFKGIIATVNFDSLKDTKRVFSFLLGELEQIKRFGVSSAELSTAKEMILREYVSSVKSMESNEFHSKNLMKHFLSGSAVPSDESRRLLLTRTLENLTSQKISDSVSRWLSVSDVDIVFYGSKDKMRLVPNKEIVYGYFDKYLSDTSTVKRNYDDRVVNFQFDTLSTRVKAKYVKKIEGLNMYEYELPNGITVLLKPDKGEERITLRAINTQMLRYDSKHEELTASIAASLVFKSGVANLKAKELAKFCNQADVDIQPFIEGVFSGFQGSCGSNSLEVMLQLMHQYIVAPNASQKELEKLIDSRIKEQSKLHIRTIADTINSTLGIRKHINRSHVEDFRNLKLNNVIDIYKQRFTSNVTGSLVLLTGDFENSAVMELVSKYLGFLPKRPTAPYGEINKNDNIASVTIDYVSETKIYSSENRDYASVNLLLVGEKGSKEKSGLAEVTNSILNSRLLERLRTGEGKVYSVVTSVRSLSETKYILVIEFDCTHESIDPLINAVIDELKIAKRNGISTADLKKAIALTKQNLRKRLSGIAILEDVVKRYKLAGDYLQFDDVMRDVDEISTEDVNDLLKRNFDGKDVMRFILM